MSYSGKQKKGNALKAPCSHNTKLTSLKNKPGHWSPLIKNYSIIVNFTNSWNVAKELALEKEA